MDRQRKDTYLLDPENVAEMARLEQQGRFLTNGMGGILPELGNHLPEGTKQILDLGCGPGEWVRAVAEAFPQIEVIGLDISEIMLEYAAAVAQEHHLENVRFVRGNLLASLPFPDTHFQLVNARALGVVIKGEHWEAAMREWFRVTQPGGMLRLTELEDHVQSNQPAGRRLAHWLLQVARQQGYGFGPGTDSLNLMPTLGLLLAQTGWQELRESHFPLDMSFGTEYHLSAMRNARVVYRQLWPIFQTLGLSLEEIEQTYQEMLVEMSSPDLKATCSFLTMCATKPA
jgi:ubiquinone/menaquinone biosynthesis C-methylase UbiE